MAQTIRINYTYDVKALDRQIRQTNALLRFVNAARATVQDFKTLADDPTFAEFFWTLIQLFRTFTALRRLMRNLQGETFGLIGIRGGGLRRAPPAMGIQALVDPTLVSQRMNILQRMMQDVGLIGINVDASINNVPVPIDRIDLSSIPELTIIELQRIMDEEGVRMEADAKRILDERIIHRDRSTGRLGRSTRWISRLPGGVLEAVAPYSFWVEEGQRSFSGHHFLRDATELARPRIADKIVSRLNRLIRDGRVS